MAAIKAVILSALITGGIFLVIIWIIPLTTFFIVFGIITLITYAIIHETDQKRGPPCP